MPKQSILFLAYFPFAVALSGLNECQGQHMNAPDASCRNAGPNSAITQCFLNESNKANDHLNQVYGKTLKALDSDEAQQLKVAQRLWLRFRDANCNAERKLYTGGSAAPTVHAACIAADTEERIRELHTMYAWRLER